MVALVEFPTGRDRLSILCPLQPVEGGAWVVPGIGEKIVWNAIEVSIT